MALQDFILQDVLDGSDRPTGYFDLQVKNGDFVVSNSEEWHLRLFQATSPGDWRWFPTIGFDYMHELKNNTPEARLALIKRADEQLKADGFKNIKIQWLRKNI